MYKHKLYGTEVHPMSGKTVQVSTSNVAAYTSKLEPGLYLVTCDSATFFQMFASATPTVALTTANGHLMPANVPHFLDVDESNPFIGFILASSTGKAYVTKTM